MLKIFGTLIVSLVFWAGFLLLFQNNLIPVPVAPSAVGKWIADVFVTNSLVVVLVTVVVASIWFWISWQQRESTDCHESVKYWWALLVFALVAIGLIVFLNKDKTGNATVYVIFSYIIHLILIYWVGTSISSAGHAKYILPGSRAIRRIVSSVGVPL